MNVSVSSPTNAAVAVLLGADQIYSFESKSFAPLPANGKPALEHLLPLKRVASGLGSFGNVQVAELPDAAAVKGGTLVALAVDGTGLPTGVPGDDLDCVSIDSGTRNVRLTLAP